MRKSEKTLRGTMRNAIVPQMMMNDDSKCSNAPQRGLFFAMKTESGHKPVTKTDIFKKINLKIMKNR